MHDVALHLFLALLVVFLPLGGAWCLLYWMERPAPRADSGRDHE
ncbi:hypothetical protein AVME950_04005 [Acidovorax sp. SUPP950]|nr:MULTISPECIES: hypothetical protein [Comamonadaceae]WOI45541.1 hypothetical protein R1Z03_24070 [Paracidovorax avenae]GKS74019.1 hypothetical protein AVME950_04005 [Acidovorax sp. SUPP950]